MATLVPPAAEPELGEIPVTEGSVAGITVKLTAGLITAPRAAVIFVVPAATPVAKPPDVVIVAFVILELAQVTLLVMLAVESSE